MRFKIMGVGNMLGQCDSMTILSENNLLFVHRFILSELLLQDADNFAVTKVKKICSDHHASCQDFHPYKLYFTWQSSPACGIKSIALNL